MGRHVARPGALPDLRVCCTLVRFKNVKHVNMHACMRIDVRFASLASSYTQRIPSRSSSGLLPSGLPTAQPAASQPLTQRPPNRSTSGLPTAHSAASQPIALMRASFVFKLFFLGTPAPTLRPTARRLDGAVGRDAHHHGQLQCGDKALALKSEYVARIELLFDNMAVPSAR